MTAQEPPPKDDKNLTNHPPPNPQNVRDEQTWERFERALKKVVHPTRAPKPDQSD